MIAATALAAATGALPLARDVVRVTGADAVSYLQGQLSQDVEALEVGESAFSLLLQPQGKVDAFLRVTRVGENDLLLDVDAGWGDAVVARLRRFLLRVKVELDIVDWPVIAVRGVGPDVGGQVPSGAWVVLPEIPGSPGYDVIGPAAVVPDGMELVEANAYEALRICAGVPRMGAELGASTIPASAGVVERTVSFTKGCYTGQELVARIDSRGDRTPTRLQGVSSDEVMPAGAVLHRLDDDERIGEITSAASLPGGSVALAYVRRGIEPPTDATARWEMLGETRSCVGRIESLPLA